MSRKTFPGKLPPPPEPELEGEALEKFKKETLEYHERYGQRMQDEADGRNIYDAEQEQHGTSSSRERVFRECKPYAWWEKSALRHIRNSYDPGRTEMNVYLALCELASDRQSENFTATLAQIGNRCRVNDRGILGEALRHLEFIGLVEVQRSKLKMASSFRLLKCEYEPPRTPDED